MLKKFVAVAVSAVAFVTPAVALDINEVLGLVNLNGAAQAQPENPAPAGPIAGIPLDSLVGVRLLGQEVVPAEVSPLVGLNLLDDAPNGGQIIADVNVGGAGGLGTGNLLGLGDILSGVDLGGGGGGGLLGGGLLGGGEGGGGLGDVLSGVTGGGLPGLGGGSPGANDVVGGLVDTVGGLVGSVTGGLLN